MDEKDRFKHIEPKLSTSLETASETGEFFDRIVTADSVKSDSDTAITKPDMVYPPKEPSLVVFLTEMVGKDTEPPNPDYPPDQKNPFWKRMGDIKNLEKIRATFEAVIKGKKPTDQQTTVDLLWMFKLLARRGNINWKIGLSSETLLGTREEGLAMAAQVIFRGYESAVDEIIHKIRVSAGANK